MPSKKRKYNARFPAGRIKKIMQTDEEVGKVAQAVPIIISRTLELFVESLLSKAMQVTVARNAKTLSPSHVKQCILAESRFDFLRDLVKNIPDVSAAEEKEITSAENSPNSSSFSDISVPRRIVREDSNSSSSSDIKIQQVIQTSRDNLRVLSAETEVPNRTSKTETVTSTIVSTDAVMDLSKKTLEEEAKPLRPANFYQETLVPDETQHRSVIQINPTYATPQPSTSNYTNLPPMEPVQRIETVPKQDNKPMFYVDVRPHNNSNPIASIAVTPNSTLQTTMRPRMSIRMPRALENPYSTTRTPATPTPRTPLTPTPRTPITPTSRTPITPTPRTPITLTPRTPITPTPRTPITPTPRTPVAPILKIDFTKNIANPEIKVLDTAVANIVGVSNETTRNAQKTLHRQNSKPAKSEHKKVDAKPIVRQVVQPVDIDHINSGNLQIDEDYDT